MYIYPIVFLSPPSPQPNSRSSLELVSLAMQFAVGHLSISIPSVGHHSMDLSPCDGPYVLGRCKDINDHVINSPGICTSCKYLLSGRLLICVQLGGTYYSSFRRRPSPAPTLNMKYPSKIFHLQVLLYVKFSWYRYCCLYTYLDPWA